MFFIDRNDDGSLKSINHTRQYPEQEALPPDHADIVAYQLKVRKTLAKAEIEHRQRKIYADALWAGSPEMAEYDTLAAAIDAATTEAELNTILEPAP